ncbi:MAG: hypothetical protein U9R12_03485 [Candidatus Caldatribacteriota bacterium]|nr:hypothetical protein [Candidatus Caldatribacteriota bacterium]
MSGIISIVGGVFHFISYVTDYFKNGEIRNTQKKIDQLSYDLRDAKETIRALESKEISDEAAYKIECETKISTLEARIQSLLHVNKKARKITG